MRCTTHQAILTSNLLVTGRVRSSVCGLNPRKADLHEWRMEFVPQPAATAALRRRHRVKAARGLVKNYSEPLVGQGQGKAD